MFLVISFLLELKALRPYEVKTMKNSFSLGISIDPKSSSASASCGFF